LPGQRPAQEAAWPAAGVRASRRSRSRPGISSFASGAGRTLRQRAKVGQKAYRVQWVTRQILRSPAVLGGASHTTGGVPRVELAAVNDGVPAGLREDLSETPDPGCGVSVPVRSLVAAVLATTASPAAAGRASRTWIGPRRTTAAAEVGDRFVSFAVDVDQPSAARSGTPGRHERDPRRPYDFGRPALPTLAGTLGPTYLRLGGSASDVTDYDLSDAPVATATPYREVLTRPQWDGPSAFARELGPRDHPHRAPAATGHGLEAIYNRRRRRSAMRHA